MAGSLAIVDSGGANIASLEFAFARLGIDARLTTDAELIRSADKVLLPGVGAARASMDRLRQLGLIDVIRQLTQPVLGICLGMQLLAEASEEEDVECLGLIPTVARQLPADSANPVPNMGWCQTTISPRAAHAAIVQGLPAESWYYYLHSYALPVGDFTVATALHSDAFSAIVQHRNFVAAQFHPERSSSAGAHMLRNFATGPV